MDYYSIINLDREPFSNSPDPAYFYHSRLHVDCLQKLELSLRLRRGLNVVVGEVGTGKTTLCRQLIQRFAEDESFEPHLILDPEFPDAPSFLDAIAPMICGTPAGGGAPWEQKEQIKTALFEKGVEQDRTVVLIIDEGQKIQPPCLEILRELLNYETNEAKLLQIVIFAQTEFEAILADRDNLADRINLFHRLGALGFSDTRRMIRYRLAQAGSAPDSQMLFTFPGLWAIYRATGGYPRKIIHLCHKAVLAAIIQNRRRAGWFLVRSCAQRSYTRTARRPFFLRAGLLSALLMAVLFTAGLSVDLSPWPFAAKKATEEAPIPPAVRKAIPKMPRETERAAPLPEGSGEKTTAVEVLSTVPASPSASKRIADSTGVSADPGDAPAEEGIPSAGGDLPAPDEKHAALASIVADVGDPPRKADGGQVNTETEDFPVKGPVLIRKTTAEAAVAPLPPEVLGKSAPQRYEVLSWMMIKVYGDYNHNLRRQLARANPRIFDLDNIEVGQPIRFPAIVTSVRRQDPGRCWVLLEEFQSLDQAFDLLRRYPSDAPAIRMVPHWSRTDGIRFSVVMWSRFASETEARRQIDAFPEEMARPSRVVYEWNREDVFFADPYQVR
jgi:general secretion pathway protein A